MKNGLKEVFDSKWPMVFSGNGQDQSRKIKEWIDENFVSKQQTDELIEALGMTYEQYCSDGHGFMTAGENAENVLQDYGYRFDQAGRITEEPTPSA